MRWEAGPQTPNNCLMEWVAHTYGWADGRGGKRGSMRKFLDIGCGAGANADWLRYRGHEVVTVDINPAVCADYQHDICDCEFEPGEFDCVYDVNTLCHVKEPPFFAIREWLKPGGFFFCMGPTEHTCKRIVEQGKDFTRYGPPGGLVIFGDKIARGGFAKQIPHGEVFTTWIRECRT